MSAPATGSTLQQLSAARRALERATTIEELMDIRDIAVTAEAWLRRRRDSLDAQNDAAGIRLRAERKIGGMLADVPRSPGGRPARNSAHDGQGLAAVLREHGIAWSVAERWQREAAVAEAAFETWLADLKDRGAEITSAALLDYAGAAWRSSTGNQEWYTGVEVGAGVGRFWGYADLDPCAPEGGPPNVPVRRYFTAHDNGLLLPWAPRTFTNPPYPPDEWVDKGLAEVATGNVRELILLVTCSPDTGWWDRLGDYPFWSPNHRLSFSSPDNPGKSNPNFASALFYIGPDVAGFRAAFGKRVYRALDAEVAP